MKTRLRSLCIIAAGMLLSSCGTTTNSELGLADSGKLARCPDTPNCVSSDATEGDHRIEPLMVGDDPNAAWQALIDYLKNEPNYTITVQETEYVRAEARTWLFRFVDDVEFHFRPEAGKIAMRSASRIGYSDLGENRRRLEAIRRVLSKAEKSEEVAFGKSSLKERVRPSPGFISTALASTSTIPPV